MEKSVETFKHYIFHYWNDGYIDVYLAREEEGAIDPALRPYNWRMERADFTGHTFVLYDGDKKELLRIWRRGFLHLRNYEMFENQQRVGVVKQSGFFLNRYAVEFDKQESWSFLVKLFSIFCRGVSTSGRQADVARERYDHWHVRAETDLDDFYFVAAVALIHWENK